MVWHFNLRIMATLRFTTNPALEVPYQCLVLWPLAIIAGTNFWMCYVIYASDKYVYTIEEENNN